MSEPLDGPTTAATTVWWTRPRIVLPLVGALVLLVAFLTPRAGTADSRLSSNVGGSLGARLLHDVAARLDWRVARRNEPAPAGRAGTRVHAVLAPSVAMEAAHAHAYLEAVRAGDGLLLVLDEPNALSDSLGVRHSSDGGILEPLAADTTGCVRRRELVPPLWADGRVHLYVLRWTGGQPRDRVVFARSREGRDRPDARVGEMAVGFPLGRGRVVVVSDPDLFRNDVIRRCPWGADVVAVRMLEWLRAGGEQRRTALEFDEYHHGFGRHASVLRTSGEFLVGHPVGRTVLQLSLAGLVLLLAMAARPLSPAGELSVERRDPLEQVDALAHAYEQVSATRTLAMRLLQGVRARVHRSSVGSRTDADERFLDDVQHRAPRLEGDVALVRRALESTLDERDLPALGAALRRIESTLTSQTSA